MRKLEYQVTFTIPAFLGNAGQQAQWRTPPFRTLLWRWWRVKVTAECNSSTQELRENQREPFGYRDRENAA
ncbi:MAG: hypothetical protein ACT4NU_13010 [Chromatiales bacterium]